MWNNHRILGFLANMLFVMAVLAMLYTINARYINLPVFPINGISVKKIGEINSDGGKFRHVTREQIEQIIHNEITGNFITVDLEGVRQAFSQLPWVRTAKVDRAWPDSLEILLEEHVALAHWDSRALANVYGEVFHAATNDKLPVFIGPAEENALLMAQSYASFRKILLPLQQTIAELSLSPRYAWRIRLDTGLELELGREQVAARLSNYASIYNHSIAHLNQQAPLAYIDLRYPNGFAVRMPETIQQKSRKSGVGKET